MKLLFVILRNSDANETIETLMTNNFRVTHMASTGGFFKQGNTTLLIGVSDEQVEHAIQLLRNKTSPPTKDQSYATIFVVPVSSFQQL